MDAIADILSRACAKGFDVRLAADLKSLIVTGPRDRDGAIVRDIEELRDDVVAYLTGAAEPPATIPEPPPINNQPTPIVAKTVRNLIDEYPRLREPVIHGLLRAGETMNVIAPPKQGKSWLVTDLALCVATGRPWLDTYETVRGDVLVVDNELHGETSAHRIPVVADARGIPLSEYGDSIRVANLRGCLEDVYGLRRLFERFAAGELRVVIIDAMYRAIPPTTDENSNGAMATLYNQIDRYALRLVLCHSLILG